MPLTLLFDLDDTLLDTNMDAFLPAYFRAFSKHLADHVDPQVMMSAMLASINLIYKSQDPGRTLLEVFDENYYQQTGASKEGLLHTVRDFYENVFPELNVHTRQRPEAVPLVAWAFERGYRIAIATDPLFPREATAHRLRWAGFDPERFELISTIEDFHFSKTYPAYYAEVLGRMGWPEGPILMVGNDVERDLAPANRLGLSTYFIDGEATSSPGFEAGRGGLGDLRPWLESIDLATLEPSYKSREAILGIMASTPAVLQSLSCALSTESWRHEPSRNDWALNEIVCHLRDTEVEIHTLQLNLMLEHDDAFIPRPDAGVWASEREYVNIDGSQALSEFAAARIKNLAVLQTLNEDIWSRKARHAIFGPTNFLEVLGFIADHDQMHIQQAWKTLKNL